MKVTDVNTAEYGLALAGYNNVLYFECLNLYYRRT